LTDEIREFFIFAKNEKEITICKNKIIFLLSDKELILPDVVWVNDIPVLFPLSQEKKIHSCANDNIIFNHDLLKSSFYLLSGYQEKDHEQSDSLGRYPFENSVQSRLNFIRKPVVNYYFEEIINGLEDFCNNRNIKITRKKIFNGFAFFLTHDVDRISYYNLNSLLNTLKQFAGFSKSAKTKFWLFKEVLNIGSRLINVFDRSDPYWNFSMLSGLEKKLGIHSAWFFLPEDQKHVDSYYKLSDKKISDLISFLMNEGHEIGLHGTVRSHYSVDALIKIKNELNAVTGLNRTGIRQHRLMWKHPDTALIHEEAGIVYDTTLGFAGYEGFRNSYCHPFRLYDFEKDRMLSYWEIPLIIMESTLFSYRNLDFADAIKTIDQLLSEIAAFNGILTLLWHNNYFDEVERPGITTFYTGLLEKIMSQKPEVLTGMDIIKKLT
jgi:peptidoglycan/xylan/chitin deacetylase (PgdA/CDA1 family)